MCCSAAPISCQPKPLLKKRIKVGAQVVLNGYHSVGIIPVDVTAMGVDFYIGGVLKWLCGGPGGVFMYVRPDLLTTLQPKVTGWFAHQEPFAFDVENLVLREDAYRLMNGTPGIASLVCHSTRRRYCCAGGC